jgi:hypothetical protein
MMDHPVGKAAQILVDALRPYLAMNPAESGKITVEIDVKRGQAKGVRMCDLQVATFTVRMDQRLSQYHPEAKKMVDLKPRQPVESLEEA